MTNIVTHITNHKNRAVTLTFAKNRTYKIGAGETKDFDFDVWSVTNSTAKANLDKLEVQGALTIRTEVLMNGLGYEVTKEGIKVQPHKAVQVPETKKTVNTYKQEALNRIHEGEYEKLDEKMGFTIAASKDAEALGATVASEQPADRTVKQPENKLGFTEVSQPEHKDNLFPRQSNGEKVNTTGLYNGGQPILEEPAVKHPEVTPTVETPETKTETVNEVESYIASLIIAEDYDTLQEYLKIHYPDVKFNKNSLKACKSLDELKQKFNI